VDVVVSAERAGAYKPDRRPYALALDELGAGAARTVFLAGSPGDVSGAAALGMPVIWHNHVGLPDRPEPAPAAEVRDVDGLERLVADVLGR
jgi:2-haloacid dehalogenase